MGYRTNNFGRGQALENDKTTTGARCIASINDCEFGRRIVRVGDVTTPCPKCGKAGRIINGEPRVTFFGRAVAVDRSEVRCDCPPGTNRVIAPASQWVGRGRDPVEIAREEQAARAVAEREAEEQRRKEERERNRVFAKSCLRGNGCTDAGDTPEPHTNFASMAFYQAFPPADPASENNAAQAARGAKPIAVEDIPKPKKRSALYKWLFGHHEEMDYQAARAAAVSAANAQMATEGASVLSLVGGRAIIPGTWAARAAAGIGEMASGLGRIAVSGPGAPITALLMGMYPGKLNEGEQDLIDRMWLEHTREAPTRVRYTWENDRYGNLAPHGWHTPPGRDSVRVRKMAWDSGQQAYTFTTEEEPRITLIWTPDSTGVNVPLNTGNQKPIRLPNPVMVDPLPEDTRITTTTTPAPEEKTFADYILILPFPDLPPIYVYLSKPPVEFLEVELYSDFKRRPRQGKYEVDHMPSKAAVETYLLELNPTLKDAQLKKYSDEVAAIVIPKEVHQKISETYGKRNATRIEPDSRNLRAAADSNIDAIKPALKEYGATEAQIEAARDKIHKLNSDKGLY